MNLKSIIAIGLVFVSATALADTKRKKHMHTASAPAATHTASTMEPSGSELTHHRMAGCGLGSEAIQDNGKWSQVAAAFLNGTGSQTFGISFGTSNCTESGVATASREKEAFIEANYADLQRDMAAGSGEYLNSLASLYGCKGEQVKNFADQAKPAFSQNNPGVAAAGIHGC